MIIHNQQQEDRSSNQIDIGMASPTLGLYTTIHVPFLNAGYITDLTLIYLSCQGLWTSAEAGNLIHLGFVECSNQVD